MVTAFLAAIAAFIAAVFILIVLAVQARTRSVQKLEHAFQRARIQRGNHSGRWQ